MKRFYAEKPNDRQLAALGLTADDYGDEPPMKVLPDCWDSLTVFAAMATQWRFVSAGMAGAFQTGLDYSALPAVFDVHGITEREAKKQVFLDLQQMEEAALKEFAQQRK